MKKVVYEDPKVGLHYYGTVRDFRPYLDFGPNTKLKFKSFLDNRDDWKELEDFINGSFLESPRRMQLWIYRTEPDGNVNGFVEFIAKVSCSIS